MLGQGQLEKSDIKILFGSFTVDAAGVGRIAGGADSLQVLCQQFTLSVLPVRTKACNLAKSFAFLFT